MHEINSNAFPETFDYVQRWGNHASVPLLERSCSLFKHASHDGIIGYHAQKSSLIVFGDPLIDTAHRASFIEAFHTHHENQKNTITYLNASQEFTHWFCNKYDAAYIGLGNELIVNPSRDVRKETGFYARDLRWKHKKSLRAGISVHEYNGQDVELEKAIEHIGNTWLAHRKGRQACLFPLNIFKNRVGKRWFYALQNGSIIGILIINRLSAHHGWVLNMLMCTPQAVNSTSAFMLMHLFEQLTQEGCTFFSAGFIPENKLLETQGFGKPTRWFMEQTYKMCSKALKLKSKKQFWNQFEPVAQPTYLICPKPWSLKDFTALMKTLHIMRT